MKSFGNEIKFYAEHTAKYESVAVRGLSLDEDESAFCVRRNRIVCYTDEKYPYMKRLRENFLWTLGKVHFVSFENECIVSVYDYRGCDIVFASREKMREFYEKLKPYLFEYDMEEMKKE